MRTAPTTAPAAPVTVAATAPVAPTTVDGKPVEIDTETGMIVVRNRKGEIVPPSSTDRALALLSKNPAWLPVTKGDNRAVNVMLDDGILKAEYKGRGVIAKLTVTGKRDDSNSVVADWLESDDDTNTGRFLRAVRDGIVTAEHVIAAAETYIANR